MPWRLADLPPPARSLADASLRWLEGRCDRRTGLFGLPGEAAGRVRESVWVAHGLLLRDGMGDRARAVAMLERVLASQLSAPGAVWHGTFSRFDGEAPPPREGAREWIDYDPNWRQFIGCAFALILKEHRLLLPAGLASRLEASIALAREGEPPDRVSPRYANIALMRAWLDVEAGAPGALDYAREVVALFDRHGAFEEFGSPTYYGVDLTALALWAAYSRSLELRREGRRVGEALWRDVARFYHAGLRQLAGPYSRAYGMDMCAYVAGLGLWIRAAVGAERAPLPDLSRPFAHAHDLAKGPMIALLAAQVPPPAEVLGALEAFGGERTVERRITDDRVATAWLAEDVAFGGEDGPHDWHDWEQYHGATLHWRVGRGVGWMRVRHDGNLRAAAGPGTLSVELAEPGDREGGGTRLVFHARGLEASGLEGRAWRLPGLALEVEGDLEGARIEPAPDGASLHLPGGRGRSLRFVRA